MKFGLRLEIHIKRNRNKKDCYVLWVLFRILFVKLYEVDWYVDKVVVVYEDRCYEGFVLNFGVGYREFEKEDVGLEVRV